MRRGIAFSVLAEFGATVSMVATFRLAVELWGNAGLGEWAISRRLLALLVPALTIGLDVALPWAIAKRLGDRANGQVAASTGTVLVLSAVLIPGLYIARNPVASLVFGDPQYVGLVMPVAGMAVGSALYVIVYGYLRGTMQIMKANLAHVLMYGIAPLVVMLTVRIDAATVMVMLAAASAVPCSVLLGRLVRRNTLPVRELVSDALAMAQFGASRVVGALLLILLSLAPASYVAATDGIAAGGFVALALSIVGMAGSLFVPLGVTLLPQATRLAAEGRLGVMRASFFKIERAILVSSAPVVVVGFAFAPVIAWILAGKTATDVVTPIRLAMLAIPPLVYFTASRPLIDACSTKAENTINIAYACVIFAAALIIGFSVFSNRTLIAMISYASALLGLAVLSWRSIRRILG
jgi:O-antigen/teichoic acid export membrane protein